MPFKSKAQQRACYAKDDPRWDCQEWGAATKKELPERVPAKKSAKAKKEAK